MKLKFNPFTDSDANKLLTSQSLKEAGITDVKSASWFDKNSKTMLTGIMVKTDANPHEWINLCDGSRAVVFDNRSLANQVIRKMKKQVQSSTVMA